MKETCITLKKLTRSFKAEMKAEKNYLQRKRNQLMLINEKRRIKRQRNLPEVRKNYLQKRTSQLTKRAIDKQINIK